MLTLLLWVCILGVVAWVIQSVPMPDVFKKVAIAIIVILLLLVLFQAIGGGSFNVPALR
jgi:hypothetical protein